MSRHDRTPRTDTERTTLYDEIIGKIIAELEAGRMPWVQPWGTAAANLFQRMTKPPSTEIDWPVT